MMKRSIYLSLLLALVLSLFALPAFASEHEEEETEELTCDSPMVAYILSKTDAECAEILALHESGVGFGEMMKAIIIAEGLEEEEGEPCDPEGEEGEAAAADEGEPGEEEGEPCEEPITWETLLELHQDGIGWGPISHAFGLADYFEELAAENELDGLAILALHTEDGLGWGQIVKVMSIAAGDLGAEVEEALMMIQDGMGWGEIRQELELDPGPPPWAGQGPVKKGNLDDHPSQNKGLNEDRQPGPPPWAGPKDKSDDSEEPEDSDENEASAESEQVSPAPGNSQGRGNQQERGNSGKNGNGNGGNGNNGNGKGKGRNR